MKRVLFSIVALLSLLTFSVTPVRGGPRGFSGITAVWANEGGDKVTRDELRATTNPAGVLNRVWDGSTISLLGAGNEVLGFNLVLEAALSQANNVSVSFNQLIGPGGYRIGSAPYSGDPEGLFRWTGRNIELFYIRYLQIQGLSCLSYETYDERHIPERLRRPYTGEGYGSGTWWDRPDHDKYYPEIAVPQELHPSFSIAAGQNQSVWVDIYIPRNAPAGQYSGTFTVREGAAELDLPVELTVRNFRLPDRPSIKTMIFIGDTDLETRYGHLTPLLVDRHFMIAHRHRLSLIDAGANSEDRPPVAWEPRLDGSLFTAENGYDGPGTGVGNGVYSIGTYSSWWWMWDRESRDEMWAHTNGWEGWFQAHAPQTERFLYLIDESGDYPQIEEWAGWMDENPGVGADLMSFATIQAPTAVAETPSLNIAASWMTVGQTEEWDEAAGYYAASADRRLFLYNGNRPAGGSFATEDDGVALRELPWGQYKKGIDRWFFWESTYYNNFQGGTGETNVFQQAQTFGGHSGFDDVLGETGWNYSNGDGVLFYPGTDNVYPGESYGVDGPFASLRLKHWRRGIQDVEYLVLAERYDPVRVAEIVNDLVPTVLWEYGVDDPGDPTWVRTDISWSTDPEIWEAARAELAGIIESHLYSGPERLVAGPGPGYGNPPWIRTFPPQQDAAYEYEFSAYSALHFGVNVSCGQMTGDGVDDILTGAGPGSIYGPHVRGFRPDGTPLPHLNFLAYGTNKYGVNVAAGDIDADGIDEILTGAGPGAVFGPHVRAFDYDGSSGVTPVPGVSYFAYGTPRWGVNVTAGDIDGDGYDEIVTGAGPGPVYGPHVRGWNVDGGTAAAIPAVSFLAYGTNKFGVNVTCGDVDGDGIDEIVTGAGPGQVFGAHVRGWNFDGAALAPITGISFFAWVPNESRFGATVFAGADLDDDDRDEIVVGPGPDPSMATPVKVYRYDGMQVIQWISLEAFPGLTHGANVAAGLF